MTGPEWNHACVTANGVRVHHVRCGAGFPLVLLHGWPEFWYAYRKNIPALARDFDVVAPDLRGFGDSEKTPLPDPPQELLGLLVEDLRGLADALGLGRFGIVSHDVGAYVAQGFARKYPERLAGLFFFDCPYPGIGGRWVEPDAVNEIWYQSFHLQPWAASLVGATDAACETYLRHFLDHWAYEPGLFDEDVGVWVENFMKPGNLQGGFDWYVATNEGRLGLIRDGAPEMEKIGVPARFLWGEGDPVVKARWADRLGDFFADYSIEMVQGAGHFVPYEKPDLANREIAAFFGNFR